MPSEMEEILRDVALSITDRLAKQRDFDNITIERVLRDSGLLRLLEAGDKMGEHETFSHFEMRDGRPGSAIDHSEEYHPTIHPKCRRCKWDAAKTAMKDGCDDE